jgi:hypothetical protein
LDVFQWHAGLISRAGKLLAHSIETTDPAKLDWVPGVCDASKCRTAVDQAAECVRVNESFAAKLSAREPAKSTPVDASNAAVRVRESANLLAAAVRDMTPEELDRMHEMPWGPMAGAALLEIALNNMNYHAGQINQIQLMYGDTDFRIPPDYFE